MKSASKNWKNEQTNKTFPGTPWQKSIYHWAGLYNVGCNSAMGKEDGNGVETTKKQHFAQVAEI